MRAAGEPALHAQHTIARRGSLRVLDAENRVRLAELSQARRRKAGTGWLHAREATSRLPPTRPRSQAALAQLVMLVDVTLPQSGCLEYRPRRQERASCCLDRKRRGCQFRGDSPEQARVAGFHVVAHVIADWREDIRIQPIHRLPMLVGVATLAVDTWVHFQRRRPGQVVQNRGVDEAVLQRYELSGRRQGNRLPNLSGRHAPLGQRLQEIPFVCCFPGNEVAGTG